MACNTNCSSCSGCCGGCGGELFLTRIELELLERFAQLSFLPLASRGDREEPVYREERAHSEEDYRQNLLWLKLKGLITLDYDLPLSSFDYAAYADCSLQGSMALTAAGQQAVEYLSVLGAEEL